MSIGCYITALGRVALHEAFFKLTKAGFRIAYGDTDSAYAIGPSGEAAVEFLKDNMPIGPCLGEWKFELSAEAKVTSFTCLAPKSYHVSFIENGVEKHIVKTKGLSLENQFAHVAVLSQYNSLFQAMVLCQEEEIMVPRQTKIRKDTNLAGASMTVSSIALKSLTYHQRIVKRVGKEWVTKPYGYIVEKK